MPTQLIREICFFSSDNMKGALHTGRAVLDRTDSSQEIENHNMSADTMVESGLWQTVAKLLKFLKTVPGA